MRAVAFQAGAMARTRARAIEEVAKREKDTLTTNRNTQNHSKNHKLSINFFPPSRRASGGHCQKRKRMPAIHLLFALCATPALAGVTSKLLMFYESGPEGSGPMPSSVALAAHSSSPLTATVAQYLNDPIGVQAFSAAAGADSPIWSYWPESVDMDLVWELVGSQAPIAQGGVDSVVMQYSNELFTREDANCTLWGVSTSPTATAFKPIWTVKVPHCAPVSVWGGGQSRNPAPARLYRSRMEGPPLEDAASLTKC